MKSEIRIGQAKTGHAQIDRAKIRPVEICQAQLCQAVACETAVFEAAFGDIAIPVAAAPKSTQLPRWRRAQFLLKQIFRATLRLTARISHRGPRRLHLCENLPLGERRFVAVVEFERTRFLVGGTPSSLVLLARLGKAPEAEAGGTQEEAQEEGQEKGQERERALAGDAFESRAAEAAGGVQP